MTILYIGDVMGELGIATVEAELPALRRQYGLSLIIAQAENVSAGRGITSADFKRLQKAGVDFFTGGNHIFDRPEIFPQLSDPAQPVIRPANYPAGTPGLGWKYAQTAQGPVLVISLLGHIVGKDADQLMDNPLHIVDSILESQKNVDKVATIINFHGDYSSEKVVIGQYLDGRVTAVIGDHWHVPTADARILPRGTAHITDVGMVGALDSSLGVKANIIIERWREGKQNRNLLETEGARQFNAVVIKGGSNGLAESIERVQVIR
jgi:metallophosphoesterase (TIGR00282 family)